MLGGRDEGVEEVCGRTYSDLKSGPYQKRHTRRPISLKRPSTYILQYLLSHCVYFTVRKFLEFIVVHPWITCAGGV